MASVTLSTMLFAPASLVLKPNQVHLWLIDQQDVLAVDMLPTYAELLSDNELKRMAELQSTKRKQQYLITRAALRSIVTFYRPNTAWHDSKFTENSFGKPALMHGGMHFNLSHSADKIVIGFSAKQSIGVDIEQIQERKNLSKIAEKYFHFREWEENISEKGTNKEHLFYKLWTLKEAFIKAKGTGLKTPLHQFYFDLSQQGMPLLVQHSTELDSSSNWMFQHKYLQPNYSLAVALEDIDNNNALKVIARQYVPLHSTSQVEIY